MDVNAMVGCFSSVRTWPKKHTERFCRILWHFVVLTARPCACTVPGRDLKVLVQTRTMKPGEQEELNRLCIAVIHEPDPQKLSELVAKLNEFLEGRERKKNFELSQPTEAKKPTDKVDEIESILKKSA